MGSRGLLDVTVMEALAKLIVSTSDERVQNVLLRIKSCESNESNSKAVSSSKVPELQATLMFLRGIKGDIITREILELLQAGLVHCVLLEVSNLLPYRCTSCSNAVVNQRLEEPSVHCRGCGVGACSECFSTAEMGWTFLCHPCGITLDKKRMIPVHLKNSRGRKKSSATPPITPRENTVPEAVNEEVTIEDIDETTIDSSNEIGDSQDDTNYLPLGQGSPPFQSTQAGASIESVREFPELSIDLSRIQGSSSQTVSGSGDGNADTSEDQSNGFIQPPKRVKAALLKQKQANRSQEVPIPTTEDVEVTPCRLFLKGCCKFGFYGKGKAGQGKCPFKHPKTCKKLMDNGTGHGGCTNGKTCEAVHPKMCHQSLTTRSCSNIKDGARCTGGYHVRGTKYSPPKPLGAKNSSNVKTTPEVQGTGGGNRRVNTSSSVLPTASYSPLLSANPISSATSLGEQQAALNSVFSEIIQAEVIKLLQTGTLWPQLTSQSCGPAVPPVAPRGQDATTTMGNLGALLSLLGSQQHQ
jgi:hypothetical protein